MNTRTFMMIGAMALSLTTVLAQGAGTTGTAQGGAGQGQNQQRQQRQLRQGMQGQLQMAGPGLLLNEAVQKELKMTPEQVEKAKATFGARRQQAGAAGQGQRRQGDAGGGAGTDVRQILGNRQQEAEKQVKEILDEKQFARFQQLQLQQQGAAALARPDVADKVGLSQEQKDKIRQIQQDSFSSLREAMQAARNSQGSDRQAATAQIREKMMKAREEANAKAIRVLTAEQKMKWDDLLGPAFNFEQIRIGKK